MNPEIVSSSLASYVQCNIDGTSYGEFLLKDERQDLRIFFDVNLENGL